MKLFYTICILAFLSLTMGYAQDLQATFSEKMKLTNKKTGFYSGILGETEEYIFVQYKTERKREVWLERIGVHDKSTMKEIKSLKIVDGKDKLRKAELGNKVRLGTHLLGNNIFVFFTEYGQGVNTIFCEVYDVNLDRKREMTELVTISKNAKGNVPTPVILVNNQHIVLGRFEDVNDQITYTYNLFNFELEQISEASLTLPVPEEATLEGNLFSVNNYILDNNGVVYFNQRLAIKTSKRFERLLGESYRYESYLTLLKLETGESQILDLNEENKSLFNVKLIENKGQMNILGFFSDYTKDKTGVRTHGVFYRKLDPKTMDLSDVVYSYFSQALIDELFEKDVEDKLSSKRSRGRKAEEEAEKNADALSSAFTIEKVTVDEAGNLVLFCSKMYNYTVEHCSTNSDGRTHCYTSYHCEKSNVTVFKMNQDGTFIWASNIDRKHTYNGWDISDLNVVEDEDNYYVSYASNYKVDAQDEETAKAQKEKKSNSEYVDYFEYGVFNKSTGENRKNALKINEDDASTSEKKYCAPSDITVINNQFYLPSLRKYTNPVSYLTCLCPPVYIVSLLLQNNLIQDASIGKLELVR